MGTLFSPWWGASVVVVVLNLCVVGGRWSGVGVLGASSVRGGASSSLKTRSTFLRIPNYI